MGIEIGGGTVNTAPYLAQQNADRAFALQMMQLQQHNQDAFLKMNGDATNQAIAANNQNYSQQRSQDAARGADDQARAAQARAAALQQMQMQQQQSFHNDALSQHTADQAQAQGQFDDSNHLANRKLDQQGDLTQEQIDARKADNALKYQTLSDNAQARLQALQQHGQEVGEAKQQAAFDRDVNAKAALATKLGRDDLLQDIPAFVQARHAALSGQPQVNPDDLPDDDTKQYMGNNQPVQRVNPDDLPDDDTKQYNDNIEEGENPQQTEREVGAAQGDVGPNPNPQQDARDSQPVDVDAELTKTFKQRRDEAMQLKKDEEARRVQSAADAQSHRKFEEAQTQEKQQAVADARDNKEAAKDKPTKEYLQGIDNEMAAAPGQEKYVAAAHLAKMNKALPDGYDDPKSPNFNPILKTEVATFDAEEQLKAKNSLTTDHPYTPDPGSKVWRVNAMRMHSDELKGVNQRAVRQALTDAVQGKATTMAAPSATPATSNTPSVPDNQPIPPDEYARRVADVQARAAAQQPQAPIQRLPTTPAPGVQSGPTAAQVNARIERYVAAGLPREAAVKKVQQEAAARR